MTFKDICIAITKSEDAKKNDLNVTQTRTAISHFLNMMAREPIYDAVILGSGSVIIKNGKAMRFLKREISKRRIRLIKEGKIDGFKSGAFVAHPENPRL